MSVPWGSAPPPTFVVRDVWSKPFAVSSSGPSRTVSASGFSVTASSAISISSVAVSAPAPVNFTFGFRVPSSDSVTPVLREPPAFRRSV